MKLPTPTLLPSGSYRIRLQLGDKRVSVTAPTKKECLKAAERRKVEYEYGIAQAENHAAVTLSKAMARYIAQRENVLSPSTVRGYKEISRNRFKSYHERYIDEINWQVAVSLESKLCGPKTLKNAWAFVKAVLAENGIAAVVRLPAQKPAKKAWLTPEQIPIFIEAMRGRSCEIPALLALSSLRKSEIFGLSWDNVDLDNDIIHIRQSKIKGPDKTVVLRDQNKTFNSTRDVPIIQPLHDALVAQKEKTGLVVKCHFETPYKQIQYVCEQNGLPKVGMHGLRHSFASLCYHLGVSELECMKMGGWSDYGTMRKIYTHLSESDQKAASSRFSQFFTNGHEMDTKKSGTA